MNLGQRRKALAYLFISVTGAASFFARTAFAQESTSAASASGGGIEEVIVTAQKRAENAQNVPIAISAYEGSELQKIGITDSHDLQMLVPSLNYSNDSGFAQPYLRGIGSDVNVPGAEASVATFVDGVYVEQQQGQIIGLLGVDRVEVLAGPQGTLYGRNASGGAINIYTLTPSDIQAAKLSATFGNYGQEQFTGYVSGAVTDNLDAGIYVAASHRHTIDDFVHPVATNQPTADNDVGARLKAVWQPIEAVKLTGSIEHTYSQFTEVANRNIQPDAVGYLFGATPIFGDYKYSADQPQFLKTEVTTAIGREEVDLSFGQLVGITGYRDTKAKVNNDLDGTNANVLTIGAPVKSKQFSQELQLLSQPDSPVTWIAGLYYFFERGGYLPVSVSSPIIFQPAPFTTIQTSAPERTRSYAAYAQATVPFSFIMDGLALTVGGRLTEDQKAKLANTESFLNGGVDVIPSISFPGVRKSWSKFTPKITLQYKTGETLFYATYAEGYKSGTFNNDVAGDDTPVAPESLTDYEAGVKSDFLNNRMRLNVAAYYYDLKNLQVQVLDPTNGASAVLRNAASARAYGIEATAIAAITTALTLDLSGAWENSKYTKFPNAPFYVTSPFGNAEILGVSATGDQLERAPSFVGTVAANYNIPLSSGAQVNVNASGYYNSGFSWDPTGQLKQGSYGLLNAYVEYVSQDDHWNARLWGKNLANTHYLSFSEVTSAGTYARDDLPRMFGVTVGWQY